MGPKMANLPQFVDESTDASGRLVKRYTVLTFGGLEVFMAPRTSRSPMPERLSSQSAPPPKITSISRCGAWEISFASNGTRASLDSLIRPSP